MWLLHVCVCACVGACECVLVCLCVSVEPCWEIWNSSFRHSAIYDSAFCSLCLSSFLHMECASSKKQVALVTRCMYKIPHSCVQAVEHQENRDPDHCPVEWEKGLRFSRLQLRTILTRAAGVRPSRKSLTAVRLSCCHQNESRLFRSLWSKCSWRRKGTYFVFLPSRCVVHV